MTKTQALRMAILSGVAASVLASFAGPASAEEPWQHRGGWNGGHERNDWGRGGGGPRGGNGLGGALLGFGIGAALGAAIVAPPVYYAPAPVYRAPPGVYYGPPPVVYYGY